MLSLSSLPLPALRQELALYPAPPQHDGSPVWSLHDPATNRFYMITWTAFEILSRWRLGTADAIAEAVRRDTTLEIQSEDVTQLIPFLESNFLTDLRDAAATARLGEIHNRMKISWWMLLIKNYLFFRVPLLRPQRFLGLVAPACGFLFSTAFPAALLILALGALLLLGRHWDQFVHSFTAYRSIEGVAAFMLAIPAAKLVHEFGHGITAHRYGCKVPAMGVAFLVMTPMLYTDTNEAWKLRSRSQRLLIGSAGIIAETALAIAATWAWLLLPDGPLRSSAFFLSTTAWTMTLALNASPFMRFDGYFILSDLLSLPNLHSRAFAFGRHRLRRFLFGLNDPEPEVLKPGLRRFLTLFAYSIWIYRLVVFFGIALLVYHYFFKALGILLFAIEVVWFITLPIVSEVRVWWQRRAELTPNGATMRTLLLVLLIIGLLLAPWQGTVTAPGILGSAREQRLVAPVAARLVELPVRLGQSVQSGMMLARLHSPDIEQRRTESLPSASVSNWQVTQQAFNEELLNQGGVLRKRQQGDSGVLAGIRAEQSRLLLSAPFQGTVVYLNDDIMIGGWVAPRESIASVADLGNNRIDAYLEERDLRRIQIGAAARFIPDALEFGTFSCRVATIDQASVTPLDDPSLASSFGGPIPTQQDLQHELVPLAPRYRVRLDQCQPSRVPPFRLRGVVHLEASRQSPILELLRYAGITLIRESGF